MDTNAVINALCANVDAKDARIAELERAFRWVLENEVWWTGKEFVEYMGQGECQYCSGPPDVRNTVIALMRPTAGKEGGK